MRSANKNNLQDFFSKGRTIGNNRKWGDNSEKQIPARETCLKKTLQAVEPKMCNQYRNHFSRSRMLIT